MPRLRSAFRLLPFVLLGASPLAADPPLQPPAPASPYGTTYTPEELAALDRALHAGNMTREDLTFRKDMAKGTYCLPIVKAMLRDPLLIASKTDELVAALAEDGITRAARASGDPLLALFGLTRVFHAASALFSEAAVSGTVRLASEGPGLISDERFVAPGQGPDGRRIEQVERLLARLSTLAGPGGLPEDDERVLLLRRDLPTEMLMREVIPSGLDAEQQARVKTYAEGLPPAELHVLAASLLMDARGPVQGIRSRFLQAWNRLCRVRADWPADLFPKDAPWVHETPEGRVAIGTAGDDVYEGDFAVVVDPGGNDTYRQGRFGAAPGGKDGGIGLLLDLSGNDTYDCGDVDGTLGSAILGVGILMDLGGGNDRYTAGHLSLGAAVGGMAVLYDDGGSDTYQGKTFTQGAAGYGIGILYDDALQPAPAVKTDEETKDPIAIAAFDNDRFSAWCTAQGFSRTLGVGLCINTRGNDTYEAGGVYLHAPLFSDRYQSFSQGFSIGAREHDMAGGVAALIDLAGNDRYLGDIYNQGVGYWYAAGLLYDGGGHDHYEMTQYGQGSGIHLAVGGLIDAGGSDAYVMHSGLGQGGSHDYAASVLHDRGGNDRYHGSTSCNGTGLTNSVGLHIDRAGDDVYATRRDGGFNAGRPARGFGSVGVLLDLGGKDDYLGPPSDEAPQDERLWRTSDIGIGLDVLPPGPPAADGGGSGPSAARPASQVELPKVVAYEGALTQEVFDELWALSVRWEVGDNQVIVPAARKRLVAFGKYILPMLDAKLEKDESGLEIRAYVDIFKGLTAAGAGDEVRALLARNLALVVETGWLNDGPVRGQEAADRQRRREALVADRRRRVALQLVGELKLKELAPEVAALLQAAPEPLDRRAAAVLGSLETPAGREHLLAWLHSGDDEARVLAALGSVFATGAVEARDVRHLLDHPLVTVRTRLATLAAGKLDGVGAALVQGVAGAERSTGPSVRARRTGLDILVRGTGGPIPDAPVWNMAESADWGLRADLARLLRHWQRLAADGKLPAPLPPEVATTLDRLRQDADPYVRACAGESNGVRPPASQK